MSENLILGSSHALYFAAAVGAYEADWRQASTDLIEIKSANGAGADLLFTTNQPNFLTLRRDAGGEIVADFGALMDKVRRFNRPGSTVVFNIGGNEHNIRFLCASPDPFDFVHPSVPGVIPGRQIVPLRVMGETLRAMLERTLTVTRLIAAELPQARRFYLPPPPPIASEAQIRTNPAVFDFAANGIEDARVRLKIYSLYLEAVSAFCDANGLTFLPPPAANRDPQGFLREAYWDGSTHASSEYYRGVALELGL